MFTYAIYIWENKQFLVSQYNIVFYLKVCVAKPESVCNILFGLIYWSRLIKGSHVLFFVFLRTLNTARIVSKRWYGTNHFSTKIIIILIYWLVADSHIDWRMNFSLPIPPPVWEMNALVQIRNVCDIYTVIEIKF